MERGGKQKKSRQHIVGNIEIASKLRDHQHSVLHATQDGSSVLPSFPPIPFHNGPLASLRPPALPPTSLLCRYRYHHRIHLTPAAQNNNPPGTAGGPPGERTT